MGLLDFFDSRKSLAKCMAKTFTHAHKNNPQLSDQDIIALAIHARYLAIGLKPHQDEILRARRQEATDIFSLCHLIAEVELLSHLNDYDRITLQMGGENIVRHTLNVIDNELIRLGFQRQTT